MVLFSHLIPLYICYTKSTTMAQFDRIIAIYNPNSTNNAAEKAEQFKTAAKKAGFTVHLFKTTHAGHAEEIAFAVAKQYTRPLIISVSGDGGYNEVVNGVMRAKHTDNTKRPVVAVIGAGNANDHKRTTRGNTPLLTLIKRDKPKLIDLVRLTTKDIERYAHSYIGLGITPEVGIELNKHSLSFVKELQIILKTFRDFTPFEIIIDGKRKRLGSLVFANIPGMAKVIKLSDKPTLSDGEFDIVKLSYRGKWRLILDMLLLAIRAKRSRSASTSTFRTTSKLPVQLDGEIEELAARSEVVIESIHEAIESLY